MQNVGKPQIKKHKIRISLNKKLMFWTNVKYGFYCSPTETFYQSQRKKVGDEKTNQLNEEVWSCVLEHLDS
jgi:hypothetical protein